jgi:phosphomannomutase/phosphoglucomutase
MWKKSSSGPWATAGWGILALLGLLCLVLGVGDLLISLSREGAVPEAIRVITLQYVPRPVQALSFMVAGALALGVGLALLRRNVTMKEAGLPRVGDSVPGRARERRRPRIVIFAGTEGLMMLLRIAREVPWDVVGIVPPVGGGVSFARLRRELDISADQVVFPTVYPVEVVAELENGEQLAGEVAIATNRSGSQIKSVRLETRIAPTDRISTSEHLGAPELTPLLKEADAVVIGPGSLFTNLIPTLLVKEINDALRTTDARKVFVCNIMTQPNQTAGFTAADHVRAIQDNCGIQLDYVLVASPVNVSQDVLGRYAQSASEIVGQMSWPDDASYITLFAGTSGEIRLVHGAILVERDDLIAEQSIITHGEGAKVVVRHNPDALARAITELIQDVALQARLSVSRAVFREYDVRGVAHEQLTERTMYVMGRAFGTFVQRRTGRNRVVLGRDVRLSSRAFHEQFRHGLLAAGCGVLDVGIVPTPLLQFATAREFADGAAMITASHNPPEFNGVKVQLGANPVSGPELLHIERIVAAGQFIDGEGTAERLDVTEPYLNCMLSKVHLERPLKVVVDGGNGTAGPLAVQALEAVGCQVVPLYCEPDGSFPNHPPDPSEEENIKDLERLIVQEGADLGVAFDGDGDRLGLVDDAGAIVMPDQYLALFARQILENGPAKIVFEVRCSQALADDIAAHGGVPIMVRCGNAFILQRMREEGAPLGGELSGHVFFDDSPINYDDPIYGACKLAEFLSAQEKKLSELVAELPQYHSSPEIRVRCPDHLKFDVVEQMRNCFLNGARAHSIARVIDVDGVRVTMQNGSWFLVRASNTQARLSIRAEAKTEGDLQALKEWVGGELMELLPDSREEIEKKLMTGPRRAAQ